MIYDDIIKALSSCSTPITVEARTTEDHANQIHDAMQPTANATLKANVEKRNRMGIRLPNESDDSRTSDLPTGSCSRDGGMVGITEKETKAKNNYALQEAANEKLPAACAQQAKVAQEWPIGSMVMHAGRVAKTTEEPSTDLQVLLEYATGTPAGYAHVNDLERMRSYVRHDGMVGITVAKLDSCSDFQVQLSLKDTTFGVVHVSDLKGATKKEWLAAYEWVQQDKRAQRASEQQWTQQKQACMDHEEPSTPPHANATTPLQSRTGTRRNTHPHSAAPGEKSYTVAPRFELGAVHHAVHWEPQHGPQDV